MAMSVYGLYTQIVQALFDDNDNKIIENKHISMKIISKKQVGHLILIWQETIWV